MPESWLKTQATTQLSANIFRVSYRCVHASRRRSHTWVAKIDRELSQITTVSSNLREGGVARYKPIEKRLKVMSFRHDFAEFLQQRFEILFGRLLAKEANYVAT